MIKLLLRFAILFALAVIFTWMADQPGTMSVTWLGYQIDEIPIYLVFGLFLLLFFVVWFAWWLIRVVFGFPGVMGDFFKLRRSRKGIEALSRGMVAVSAGDPQSAQRQAMLAKKYFADSPLAHLLEAQAAQMRGDNSRVTQIYTEMLEDPETEIVALRGLFVAARKRGDEVSARKYAERAHRLDSSLGWALQAMGAYLSQDKDWPAVARVIDNQRRSGTIERDESNRRKAVVLAAQALAAAGADDQAAVDLALKAHKLDPGLVPAAVLAGRKLAEKGALRKAAKVLEDTWRKAPHPDIAEAYFHLRAGDSAQDRLRRVKELLRVSDGGIEGAIAQARAAINARDWVRARKALSAYTGDRPPSRVCLIMAEIEDGEFGDHGRAREWLARAATAPRDPAWTADGYVSQTWLPVSPVTGDLGAFTWKVPVTAIGATPEEQDNGDMPIDQPVPGDQAVVIGSSSVPDAQDERFHTSSDDAAEAASKDVGGSPDEPLAEEHEATDAGEDGTVEAPGTGVEGKASSVSAGQGRDEEDEQTVDAEPRPANIAPPDAVDPMEDSGQIEELLPDNRQPDDPGPRKDRKVNGKRSWFG